MSFWVKWEPWAKAVEIDLIILEVEFACHYLKNKFHHSYAHDYSYAYKIIV